MLSLGNIQLTSAGQLIVAAMEKLSTAPVTNLTDGRVYYNTTSHKLFVARNGTWTEITSGQFVSAMNDFTDVTFTAPAESESIVYSNGQFVNKKIQHLYSYTGTGTTNHVVTHNLDQQIVNVEVYDKSVSPAKKIIPNSITLTSLNSCTVNLNTDIHCDIFVFGVGGDVIQMTTLPSGTGTAYSGNMTITRGEGYTQFYAPTVASRIRFGTVIGSTNDFAFEFSVHSLGNANTMYVGLGTNNSDMSNASTWQTAMTKYALLTWSTSGTFNFEYKDTSTTSTNTPALVYNRRYGFRYNGSTNTVKTYQTFPSDAQQHSIGTAFANQSTYQVILNIPANGCVRIYDSLIGATTSGLVKWVL